MLQSRYSACLWYACTERNSCREGIDESCKSGTRNTKKRCFGGYFEFGGRKRLYREVIGGRGVEIAMEMMDESPEEVVTIVAAVAKRSGAEAVMATDGAIRKMAAVLRNGPEGAKESAAAALVLVCQRGGNTVVAQLAATPRIHKAIWKLMGIGTVMAKRKAANLLRILGLWAAESNNTGIVPVSTIFADLIIF
ncbi:hypothetical protein NE237_005516 [Protea cynaroides]|uniref:Uncharacterized protein n=1 Tax=Protea cynaroides TaxID=273540 RepID=A0A9Q0QUM7_9MAGN|nr:hypothetical protein NE237_005516 [Protea cynaroides]